MTKVKICGITNIDDALLALDLGADFLGFVFASSPRRIGVGEAAAILRALPASFPSGRAVGVFVNESTAAMRRILEETGIGVAQVHGDEAPEQCASFPFPWYRALRIRGERDLEAARVGEYRCPRILFDALVEGSYGGTGRGIAPVLAARALGAARKAGKEAWLAGGIGPGNVAGIVGSLFPDGIDASSGLEESPGKKSREKMEKFFAALAAGVEREETGGSHGTP